MARSLQELRTFLGLKTDAKNVYIQRPSSLGVTCILIDRDKDSDVKYADNVKYWEKKGYTITVVSRAPDDPVPDQVEALPYTTLNRRFVTDGYYHFVYTMQY